MAVSLFEALRRGSPGDGLPDDFQPVTMDQQMQQDVDTVDIGELGPAVQRQDPPVQGQAPRQLPSDQVQTPERASLRGNVPQEQVGGRGGFSSLGDALRRPSVQRALGELAASIGGEGSVGAALGGAAARTARSEQYQQAVQALQRGEQPSGRTPPKLVQAAQQQVQAQRAGEREGRALDLRERSVELRERAQRAESDIAEQRVNLERIGLAIEAFGAQTTRARQQAQQEFNAAKLDLRELRIRGQNQVAQAKSDFIEAQRRELGEEGDQSTQELITQRQQSAETIRKVNSNLVEQAEGLRNQQEPIRFQIEDAKDTGQPTEQLRQTQQEIRRQLGNIRTNLKTNRQTISDIMSAQMESLGVQGGGNGGNGGGGNDGANTSGASNESLPEFNSEVEARAAGYGSGDRVIINGIPGTL